MSNFFHGVKQGKVATSVSTPIVASTGVHFVIGLAPVQATGGKVNEPILLNTYGEAKELLGYSDDWEKYTLCEEFYAAFMLYKVSPVVVVNVLDPEKHKKKAEAKEYTFSEEKTVLLPFETIEDTVRITGSEKGTDFETLYTDDGLIVEAVEGGNLYGQEKVTIEYSVVAPEMVTKKDIIGGYDVASGKSSGLELIDSVFPSFRVVPDIILCPGFSEDSEVAAVMAAKCESINGIFGPAKCIIDVDTETAKRYTDVPEWKNKNNITKPSQIVVWPKVSLAERVFHYSVQMACRMTATDNDLTMGDGTPCESPSNKSLQIDSLVLHDGSTVLLDLTKANFLNENGIVTGLNLMGGYVLWGNSTACYPSNTDVTDYFIPVSRMFAWVGNSVILSVWGKVDKKLNRRLIESVQQSLNLWLNGLFGEEKILGGRVEFLAEENPDINIMAGKAKFHIYLTPPSPAQEFEFLLEYDVSYLQSIVGGE